MFWPPVAPAAAVDLRITNTGTEPWPAGAQLAAGWQRADTPYLARPPENLEALDVEIPALGPGESIVVQVNLPPAPTGERALAWISLLVDRASLAGRGLPALQFSSEAP
jgi:hypothetical protein